MQFTQSRVIIYIPIILLLRSIHETTTLQNRIQFFNDAINVSREMFDTNLDESFTIQSPGCTIPSLDFLDPTIRNLVQYPTDEKCPNEVYPLLGSNKTHIWVINESIPYYYNRSHDPYNINNKALRCCYTAVTLSKDRKVSGTQVVYEECRIFNESIVVKDEFVRVTCSIVYEQFFIFAPKPKPFTLHRETPFEIPENQLAPNVLIFGMSSVSRLNFHRTMPNTLNFFKSKGAIDLKGYSKASDKMLLNVMAMLVGRNDEELQKSCWPSPVARIDRCPFIWDRFKDAGYYTALLEDSARFSVFNLNKMGYNGFQTSPTDYYLHPIIREAEKAHLKNYVPCTGNNYYFQLMLNYIENLTLILKSRKLFGIFWESSMSSRNLNNPMIMDRSYEVLLKNLHNSGYLNDTFLIFVSDEGIKTGDIRKKKQGRLEQRLPLLYILPPTSLRKKFSLAYENLKENAERLTTPYDLYNTLIDLLDLSAIKNEEVLLRNEITHYHDKSVSLFLQIPDNRTCQSAGVNKYLCGCVQSNRISNHTLEARGAASFLVRHLNEILGSYPQCARLTLESILQAVEYTIPYENDKEWHDVTVVARVKPGGGVFEGTMRHYKEGDWTMLSPVSRFNMYSDLSFCVKQYWLKMYCYCLL